MFNLKKNCENDQNYRLSLIQTNKDNHLAIFWYILSYIQGVWYILSYIQGVWYILSYIQGVPRRNGSLITLNCDFLN